MKILKISGVVILLLVIFQSCKNKEENIKKYLYISHTRINDNGWQVNPIIEKMDYKEYDLLLLGGDIAKHPLTEIKNLEYLDKIFNIGSETTHWVLGNHEYYKLTEAEIKDMKLYRKYTKKEPYYAFCKDGITFVILDTQDNYSKIVGNQLKMLQNITDTIEHSTNLIVLHHKLIWLQGDKFLEGLIHYSNTSIGKCFSCLNPNNFYKDIYPLLLKIKDKGINVTCIAGDSGFKQTKFMYETNDNILFVANGIKGKKNYRNYNEILIIEHNINTNELIFNFEKLWKFENFTKWQQKQIKIKENEIKNDSVLFFKAVEKAKNYDITLNEQIHIEALNALEDPFYIINYIKNTNSLRSKISKMENINFTMHTNEKINLLLLPISIEISNFVNNKILHTKKWVEKNKAKSIANNRTLKDQNIHEALWMLYN